MTGVGDFEAQTKLFANLSLPDPQRRWESGLVPCVAAHTLGNDGWQFGTAPGHSRAVRDKFVCHTKVVCILTDHPRGGTPPSLYFRWYPRN